MTVTGILPRAAALAALFALLQAASSSAATECAEAESCRAEETPRSSGGSAMIQSGQPVSLLESRVATGSPPLKTVVDAVEKELDDLENRVATLESQVGNEVGGGGSIVIAPAPPPPATPAPTEAVESLEPAPAEEVLMQHKRAGHLTAMMKKKAAQAARESHSRRTEQEDDDSWLYPSKKGDDSESLSLLAEGSERHSTKQAAGSLKDRVGEAERRSATVKSKIIALENAVSGGNAPAAAPDNVSGADLKHRLMALEDECDELRTRTTTLEHVVMG